MHTTPTAARIGLTLGDAAGIGPEILLGVLRDPTYADRTVIYGSPQIMRLTAAHFAQTHNTPSPPIRGIDLTAWRQQRGALEGDSGAIQVIDVTSTLPHKARSALKALTAIPFGQEIAPFAYLQRAALEAAIDDALSGTIAGITTAPWTKSLFSKTELPVLGHTEIIAERTQTPDAVMMLGGEVLKVALVTTHLPIHAVAKNLNVSNILQTIRITAGDLQKRWGLEIPRLAVAGLNPHAGEQGHMGREELDVIGPAIETARAEGYDIEGPFPADTLFARIQRGAARFDAVVCMYHDQGLIPLKMMHFGESANITLGLPIVRTSVDHGTAYDIAGQGRADIESMRYALDLAVRLVAGGEPRA